jgi:hypothetical protein
MTATIAFFATTPTKEKKKVLAISLLRLPIFTSSKKKKKKVMVTSLMSLPCSQ